jgi:hypothetical protein
MATRKFYVDDDFEGTVPDGGVVRSSVMLMDGVQRAVFDAYGARRKKPPDDDDDDGVRSHEGAGDHRPHLNDAQAATMRREARDGMIRRATDAWRSPQRDMNPAGGFTCPECHGTGIDPDGDSSDGRCDECGGSGYIETPNVGQ